MSKNLPDKDFLLGEILKEGESALLENKVASPSFEAQLLMSHVLGLKRHELFLSSKREVPVGKRDEFFSLIKRRIRGIPSQYLLNSCEFMGYDFELGTGVFVPRPETEILVCEIIAEWKRCFEGKGSQVIILDVGTGSGCIAISLALMLTRAKLIATEISQAALSCARKNLEKHALPEERVKLLRGNLFEPVTEYKGKLWAVVSNPPYVKTDEIVSLPVEVREYEPRAALDGGPDGLSLIRKIVQGSGEFLTTGGILALEIPEDAGEDVLALIETTGYFGEGRVVKDLAGKDRVVIARRGN